jgi:hypothetical protein
MMKTRYRINGREVSKEEFDAHPPLPGLPDTGMIAQGYSESHPGHSIAMGCHPDQVDLMNNTMKQHGVQGVEWDRSGKCKITSRKGRAKAMPIFGQMVGLQNCHDEDAGYSD